MKLLQIAIVILFSSLLSCGHKTIPPGENLKSAKGNETPISILTYNIHHANPPSKPGLIDVTAIANVIKQQGVDIVALQEVDVHTNRSGASLNEAEEIARLAGMTAFFAKAIDYGGGEYGVAILSKYPMENMKNTSLPTDDATKGEHRTLATATIILPGNKKVLFACTHLDAQGSDVNRQLQIRRF